MQLTLAPTQRRSVHSREVKANAPEEEPDFFNRMGGLISREVVPPRLIRLKPKQPYATRKYRDAEFRTTRDTDEPNLIELAHVGPSK